MWGPPSFPSAIAISPVGSPSFLCVTSFPLLSIICFSLLCIVPVSFSKVRTIGVRASVLVAGMIAFSVIVM